jgi:type VI secretion system secreted protein Hcp
MTASLDIPKIQGLVRKGIRKQDRMSFDSFVWIDGVEGESTDSTYAGWIEILEFGLGVRQTVSNTACSAGGATAERADFTPFIFRKRVDAASPLLALACAAGTHIDEMVVALCRAGAEKLRFMEYRMNNCMIGKMRSYAGDRCGFSFPTESVSVHFGKMQWCYTRQDRHGGASGGAIVSGWDLQKNRRI